MNYRSCEKQIFKSFGYTKIRKDWNESKVMQPTTSNNSLPNFSYHVHNQVDFKNPFISGRVFICLGISKMIFAF